MKNKGKHKAQLSKLTSKELIVSTAFLCCLLLVLFVLRGWVRMTLLPQSIETVQGNPAEKVYVDEIAKLQEPLNLLGYDKFESATKGCHTTLANGIKTQVVCSYDVRAYHEIDITDENKKILDANAEKLQALLKENGWKGEYANSGQQLTSLVKLTTNITSGIDYQPDATYEKRVGNVACYFTNNTAFSSPAKPAMASQISCTRTFNILGEPGWE